MATTTQVGLPALRVTGMDLSKTPIFVEELQVRSEIEFDHELDRIACSQASTKRSFEGYCNVCDVVTAFHVNSDNFREDLVCRNAGCINRHRQIVCGLSVALFGVPSRSLPEICSYINSHKLNVYSADANSSLYRALSKHVAPELITFSEYFGPEFASGQYVNGIRHEDLQKTSFANGIFNIVITTEVFEHIPRVYEAEGEVARILAPGGIYCFTVPFVPFHEHDIVLADVNEKGETVFFAEPQYHGDPLRPEEGILVYRIFSFNDLKERFNALECDFTTFRFWSSALGILGDNAWVLLARKNVVGESQAKAQVSYCTCCAHCLHERSTLISRIERLEQKTASLESELAASRTRRY
jgi:SAM-dependent methyltransferase